MSRQHFHVSFRVFVLVFIMLGSLMLAGQDDGDWASVASHMLIVEQGLDADLVEITSPMPSAPRDASYPGIQLFYPSSLDSFPAQFYHTIASSFPSIIERCSTYRV